MAALDELLRRAVVDLRMLGHATALVGGLAVSARTEPRFTRDIDLAVVVPDDRGAEALVNSLLRRGYRVVAVIEQETTGRMATVRLEHSATPGVVLDLLFATTGSGGGGRRRGDASCRRHRRIGRFSGTLDRVEGAVAR